MMTRLLPLQSGRSLQVFIDASRVSDCHVAFPIRGDAGMNTQTVELLLLGEDGNPTDERKRFLSGQLH